MLDNTQSIIEHFGLAAAVPRSPYRHLELCSIALKRCVSGFAGWRAESFSADCSASAPSKELYAANGRGFSRTLANSPLDCLCPAVARAGCLNPVTPWKTKSSFTRRWKSFLWSECNYRIWKNPVISMVLAHQARGFYPNFFSMRLESYDKRFFQMM